MQYVIHQRGWYIKEMGPAGITKKTENKAEAKRFDEEYARLLSGSYLMFATMEPADEQHN